MLSLLKARAVITVKKKYGFSLNIHVLQNKKALSFYKFMDKWHEIINFNK